MAERELVYEPDFPDIKTIRAAFDELFGDTKGAVHRFSRSGLRYVKLSGGTTLIEQNPSKRSRWGQQARQGHRVAWLMKEGRYLARVIDGDVQFLVDKSAEEKVF